MLHVNKLQACLCLEEIKWTIHQSSGYAILYHDNVTLLVQFCDWFDSRQIKQDPVDLVMKDYDITLRWRIVMADADTQECCSTVKYFYSSIKD